MKKIFSRLLFFILIFSSALTEASVLAGEKEEIKEGGFTSEINLSFFEKEEEEEEDSCEVYKVTEINFVNKTVVLRVDSKYLGIEYIRIEAEEDVDLGLLETGSFFVVCAHPEIKEKKI